MVQWTIVDKHSSGFILLNFDLVSNTELCLLLLSARGLKSPHCNNTNKLKLFGMECCRISDIKTFDRNQSRAIAKATRKASIGTSVIKGRLKKMWALSRRKWETWLPGIWRSLRYSMLFLSQSSLASAPATPPKSQKAKTGTGRRKSCPP